MTNKPPPRHPIATVFDIGSGQPADSHHDAAGKAIAWLTDRHRKGWNAAFDGWLSRFGPDSTSAGADPPLDQGFEEMLMTNASEWLLARGEIFVKGEIRRISAHLLGRDGPWFSPAQQRWLAQLAERPLRLWRVTDVRLGEGLTLVDALDHSAAPVWVQERIGSESAAPGLLIGARVMDLGDHFELSGATYPFSRLHESGVLAAMVSAADPGLHPDNARDLAETLLVQHWVDQWLKPRPIPLMVDSGTGDPMLLVTDHYRVLDAAALAQALGAQPDVSGNADEGWTWLEPACSDGSSRVRLAINRGRAADRIELFARTQNLADAGRAWFDAVAGVSVQHLAREVTDPRSPAATDGADMRPLATHNQPAFGPEELTVLMKQLMHRTYANWADEPIPILGNLTPRKSITTAAGLERVKGLLREYESNEANMAADDGRSTVSLQFMWDSLGIER